MRFTGACCQMREKPDQMDGRGPAAPSQTLNDKARLVTLYVSKV